MRRDAIGVLSAFVTDLDIQRPQLRDFRSTPLPADIPAASRRLYRGFRAAQRRQRFFQLQLYQLVIGEPAGEGFLLHPPHMAGLLESRLHDESPAGAKDHQGATMTSMSVIPIVLSSSIIPVGLSGLCRGHRQRSFGAADLQLKRRDLAAGNSRTSGCSPGPLGIMRKSSGQFPDATSPAVATRPGGNGSQR